MPRSLRRRPVLLVAAGLATASCATSGALRASIAATASAAGRQAAETRPGAVNSASSIATFTGDGSVVELADGSLWLVAGSSRSTVVNWSDGDSTAVIAVGELTDVGTGDTISARLLGTVTAKLRYPGLGEHRLVAAGNNGTLLALSDGSLWAIGAAGAPTVDRWPVGAEVRIAAHGHASYTLQEMPTHSHVIATYVASER